MTSLYSLMMGRGPFDKRKALSELSKLGILKIRISFSGGNDEGGVDAIEVLKWADGADQSLSLDRIYPDQYDTDLKRYVYRDMTLAEQTTNNLLDLIEQPIDDRYGSFAGDFHVSGYLHYDVAEGRVWIGGEEETPPAEGFSDEL